VIAPEKRAQLRDAFVRIRGASDALRAAEDEHDQQRWRELVRRAGLAMIAAGMLITDAHSPAATRRASGGASRG
jgi:hypothetical protein